MIDATACKSSIFHGERKYWAHLELRGRIKIAETKNPLR
jgi:hypothetical protein